MNTIPEAIYAVSRCTGVTLGEMQSRSRHPEIVFARRVCCVVMRQMTAASYPAIAEALGAANHSTSIGWHQDAYRADTWHKVGPMVMRVAALLEPPKAAETKAALTGTYAASVERMQA